MGADLLDVNVWFALSIAAHPHHERAIRYWEDESPTNRLGFCRVTALGFLRLLTNPKATLGAPLTVAQAWQTYTALQQKEGVDFWPEAVDCDSLLASWAAQDKFSGRLWTDAYLAAFSMTANLRFVSFDRDFRRFPGLSFLPLVP